MGATRPSQGYRPPEVGATERFKFCFQKKSKIIRGHNFTLVKEQRRLDVRKNSFSQRCMYGKNYLLIVCMPVVLIIMFKNRIVKYLVKAGYT